MRPASCASGLMVVWLTLASCPALAQPQPRAVWGAEIMKQPFDVQPFRAINVPPWVQETTGCGYTLSVMDSAARARAAAHGVTISEMGFVDPFFAYYDSK